LKKFSTVEELRTFLMGIEANREQLAQFGGDTSGFALDFNKTMMPEGAESLSDRDAAQTTALAPESTVTLTETGQDYCTTNVQVEGVDEPDFLKNDGKYVYILSGDRLTIVDAYPAENAAIAVKVALDIQQGQYLQNMFLNNDTLVIFYQEYREDFVIQEYDFAPQQTFQPTTHALVLDVSDMENPKVLNNYEVSGNYNNARMIGEQVYLITTSDLYDYRHPIVPLVSESSRTIVRPDIYYFDNPELYYAFNTVTSIDIAGTDAEQAVNSTTFMMNPASTLYVSEGNIYIAYQKNQPYYSYQENSKERFFEAVVPLLPQDVQQEIRDIESSDELSPSEKWDRVSELLEDTYNRMSEGEKNTLFEVSDVRNPQVVDVYEIAGSGTESEVLYDHKALLFDRGKDVLSIPVSIYPDYTGPQPFVGRDVEPKVWCGFYVFGINPEAGFNLKGTVKHFNDTGDYYYAYGTQGSRSFYIGDVLYTVTLNNAIKMNDLQSIEEINQLEIGSTGGIIKSPTLKNDIQ
jgi:inhibitor of cysteine peptidase